MIVHRLQVEQQEPDTSSFPAACREKANEIRRTPEWRQYQKELAAELWAAARAQDEQRLAHVGKLLDQELQRAIDHFEKVDRQSEGKQAQREGGNA